MKNNFKLYRKKAKLTQKEMADKLNVSRQSYIKYESGETEPSFETLKQISLILNTSIDELLNNSNIKNSTARFDKLIEDIKALVENYKDQS
ncbi:MAG TPA: transcriptional regulator [Firmicutes bacterium]|nr:transcriptional regulator [Bacillota bacterium]